VARISVVWQRDAGSQETMMDDASAMPDWGGRLVTRIRPHWRLLAAAAAALVVVHLASGGSFVLVVAAMLGLCLVAALSDLGRSSPANDAGTAKAFPEAAADMSAETLAAAIADPLIVADARGAIVMANRAAASALGDVRASLSLPLKFRTPEMQALLETMLAGESAATADYVERVPVERAYRVSAASAGKASGLFVLVFRDQSETRRIERMRADFIANASHEMRTPLASIAGFVETLLGPARNDVAARERFLGIIQEQTARMARLIDDLLSLSHLEMKALELGDRRVELTEVLASVVETLKPLAKENGVTIDNAFGSEPVQVAGDRDELFQVFQNLLENACKYGREGGAVTIERAAGSGEIGVAIRDRGPGIAPEHIPRITERFYRIDEASSRARKGTGLGLSIVKHIVARHSGRLDIRSRRGEGSTFTVFLPIPGG